MAKSLCKYRRIEIADKFAEISKIVSMPNFICSSCARVARDKGYLCKPSSLSVRSAAPVAVSAPTPAASEAEAKSHLAALSVIEHEQPITAPQVTKKQAKKLKKVAKKKHKSLKKAAKAVKQYDKAMQKAKQALQM
ncbi:hypothetical protein C9I98_22495 [Photobacterium sanctipauli]|uniref:Uncharacterized protein n=1 Tax=Photobacterium sanctipauli TaxID=1342794 RepID=A0A2T3NET7_9GAMM|nr:hypothetical protein [Photobacterium sanctipauli]PSW13070.1 hypothetical protein C9I98_22495 [Photobacterium sanctipauli]